MSSGRPTFESENSTRCAARSSSDAVVATGAGVVTTATAREMISREFAIWLDADDDTLLDRVATGDDRPLLGDDRAEGVRRLRAEREAWYRASSRVRVDAAGSLDEVLERILAVTKERRLVIFTVELETRTLRRGGAKTPLATSSQRSSPQKAPRAKSVVVVTSASLAEQPWFDVSSGIEQFTLLVPEGESAKTLSALEELLESFAERRLSRDDVVVAVGGGAITDLAGFAAAVYLRGVALVQIPTSLVGQVDAAIGGKTGVNLAAGKNLVGAFYQPLGVLCDTSVLSTLARARAPQWTR